MVLVEESGDEEDVVMEPEVDEVPVKKTRKAPKKAEEEVAPKKAKKVAKVAPKKAKKVVEVEAEVEEEEAVAVEAAEPKKERKHHKAHAHGSRFGRPPSYQTQLSRERAKRREEAIKAGKPLPAPRRSKPGTVARREAAYLSKSNGMYVSRSLVRRLVMNAIKENHAILVNENELIRNRLIKRGKTPPANLTVAPLEKWAVSAGTVELNRAAVQVVMENISDVAAKLKTHAKRETTRTEDTSLAYALYVNGQ